MISPFENYEIIVTNDLKGNFTFFSLALEDFLKVTCIPVCIPVELRCDEESKKFDSFYLKASGGFVLVLSTDGDIMFVSQNVSNFLGITQVYLRFY